MTDPYEKPTLESEFRRAERMLQRAVAAEAEVERLRAERDTRTVTGPSHADEADYHALWEAERAEVERLREARGDTAVRAAIDALDGTIGELANVPSGQSIPAMVEGIGKLRDDLAAGRWDDDEWDELEAEVERLKAEGTPGVMHAVDNAFYRETVAQRDRAWREIEALKADARKWMEECLATRRQRDDALATVAMQRENLKQMQEAGTRYEGYRAALERIADLDFRGHPSQEQSIAWKALGR